MTHSIARLGLSFTALCFVSISSPAAVAAAHASCAQDPPPDPKPLEQPVEKLKEWPKVDDAAVKVEVERLRKARTEEMGAAAQVALTEIGAGAVPFLLEKLPHEKDKQALQRMEAVLDSITKGEHTRLLMMYFSDRSLEIRVWSLMRVAAFPDVGVREDAEKALAGAKKNPRKLDPKEVFAAALCCASSGSFAGFDEVCKEAESNWGSEGAVIGVALGALRGPEATQRIAPLLQDTERKRQQAGLRLLAACGEKESAIPLVKPFLDNNDNTLRVGAINALRGIIDGDPPLDKLPVFEAIERANKWKARL